MKIKFLELGIGRDSAAVSALRRPLGYQQITLQGGVVASLTIPTAPTGSGYVVGFCVINCTGAATTDFCNWRDDGTNPTNAVGMPLFSGQELDYSGDVTALRFMLGAGAPVLNVSYYA